MVRTIHVSTEVPANRELRITLPTDVPVGPADIVVAVTPKNGVSGKTLGDLLRSEFFGMWRDRDDIEDSASFARHLREGAWKRRT